MQDKNTDSFFGSNRFIHLFRWLVSLVNEFESSCVDAFLGSFLRLRIVHHNFYGVCEHSLDEIFRDGGGVLHRWWAVDLYQPGLVVAVNHEIIPHEFHGVLSRPYLICTAPEWLDHHLLQFRLDFVVKYISPFDFLQVSCKLVLLHH